MSKQSDLVNITQGDAAISGTTGQFDTSLNVDGPITSDGLTVGTAVYPTSGALSNRNKIINGAMQVSQRGSVNVTPGGGVTYTAADRFAELNFFGSGQINTSVSSEAPTGFSKSLLLSVATAVPLSGSTSYYVQLGQSIEGSNIADVYSGNVTLSFWVRSSITGTYSVTFQNTSQLGIAPGARIYVAEYTISAADTWERKTIVVDLGVGSASGTWVSDNSAGLSVNFNLGAESNRKGNTYLNTWGTYDPAPADLQSAAQVQWASTLGATFYITGVQLEAGDTATPFEHRSYGQELALCQRYYEFGTVAQGGAQITSTLIGFGLAYAVSKRATPTVTFTNTLTLQGITAGLTGFVAQSNVTNSYCQISRSGTVGTGFFVTGDSGFNAWTASAEL